MAPGHRRWISGRPRAGPSDADRLPDTRTPARSTAANARRWAAMARVGQFRLPDSIQPRLPLVGKVARMARAPVTHRIGLSTAPLLWRLATRCHLHDANLSHMAAVMSGVQRSGLWKLIRTLAYREVTIRTYARGGSGPTRPWPRAGSVRAPARLRPPCPRGTREPRCAPSQAHASWRMSFVIRAISDPQVHRLARSHRPFSEPRSG
jgi:hypothetical protein